MTLTRRDLGATVMAALVVLVYVANVQEWWFLGSNRWAAVTMLALGAVSCPLGARADEIEQGMTGMTTPIIALAILGVTALVVGVIAIVTAAQWALLTLAIVLIVLWAGTTMRHAATPPRAIAAH